MAKANLQAQARALGLSDEGTVDDLRDRIENTGDEPDDNFETDDSLIIEAEAVPDDVAGTTNEDSSQSDEDAAAAAVVIPEYEQQIQAAAARGDDAEIERVQGDYWKARQERARQDREEAEQDSEQGE